MNKTSVEYRNLTPEEIARLENQQCTARDWQLVRVCSEGFDAGAVQRVSFMGTVEIGRTNTVFHGRDGIARRSGIYQSRLCDCRIGDNVFVENASVHRYMIGENTFISNVGELTVKGSSTFGNGMEVPVLNEAGGREVPVCKGLTAQLAYILALYRHRPRLIEELYEYIKEYADKQRSDMGSIGSGCSIQNTGSVVNVQIGDGAFIHGALELQEGSLDSRKQDIIEIGAGVILRDFIVSSGSKITENALVHRCFIGHSVDISRRFSAMNSLIFSNSSLWHGEACAVFAGPFTVSHHKNTLLIAGMFSFMNAGSGTNQSNHMYKLGPLHHGILERGCKTASNAYLLWPAKIGAFTFVSGNHYKHYDSSALPFSFLLEKEGDEMVYPAMNLKSCGLLRDDMKWPQRDRRNTSFSNDRITYQIFNPYTASAMLKGYRLLQELLEQHKATREYFQHQGLKIPVPAARKAIDLYRQALCQYLLDLLLTRLIPEGTGSNPFPEALKTENVNLPECWVDLAGFCLPKEALEAWMDRVESGQYGSVGTVLNALAGPQWDNREYEWALGAAICRELTGKMPADMPAVELKKLLATTLRERKERDNMYLRDAAREFKAPYDTGYGADGDEKRREADFIQVRGNAEDQPIVQYISEETQSRERQVEYLIETL